MVARIIKFMEIKAEILGSEIYFTEADRKELEGLNEEAIKKLNYNLPLCPFCVLNENKCEFCGYGKRHRICSDPKSDYAKSINIKGYQSDIIKKSLALLKLHDSYGVENV